MKEVLLIFTFMLPTLFFPEVCGQKLSDLVAKNEKAIFQIFAYDEFGSPSSTGTGFYINDQGKALTNVHVIEDAKSSHIQYI